MIGPGILVCSSFLISVCMFIVSKVLLISSATVIVRTEGAIWLNPFATVLFNVHSAITVECCVLYPCCVGVFAVSYVRKKALLQCLSNHAQLRTNKSPILISYLHKVDETHHPSPLCPLCKTHPHTTDHLFNCTHLYTSSNILDLWLSPERVAPLLIRWKRRLAGLL